MTEHPSNRTEQFFQYIGYSNFSSYLDIGARSLVIVIKRQSLFKSWRAWRDSNPRPTD